MGRRGPPRQPTSVLAFKGSHRAVSRAKTEPKPPDLPDLRAPAFCPPHARKYWNVLAPQLHAIGVLSVSDAGMLIMVCEAWADYAQAAGLARSRKQTQQHMRYQWACIRDRKWAHVVQGLKEFGCTPASRSRVEVIVPGLGNQTPAQVAAAAPAKPIAGAGFGAERERRQAAAAAQQPPAGEPTPPPSE